LRGAARAPGTRATLVCTRLGRLYEIVIIDDGSKDHTWNKMLELATANAHLVCVKLSRNHGHQMALPAELLICRAQRILIIDADLQDPPELLPDMLTLMDRGADVVYGQSRHRVADYPSVGSDPSDTTVATPSARRGHRSPAPA